MLKKILLGLSGVHICLLALILVLVLMAGHEESGGSGTGGGAGAGDYSAMNVSQEVLGYRPLVELYALQYGMADYVELILAVMMQESGGRVQDVMQSAEGAFNTKYPHVPNGITDPAYSIECGIQELKYCLERANVTGAADLEHIKLALQGYNFGSAYIDWAVARDGGYTEQNAIAYSDMMCSRPSWHYPHYGDKQYVEHVLQYYQIAVATVGEAAKVPESERLAWLFPNGVPRSEREMAQYLTTITVPIVNSSGTRTTMKLTVHKKLTGEIIQIFTEMANMGFPVKTGTTCGYNWRSMVSSSSQSHHSYGCVIDLNWDDNPYVSNSLTVGSSAYAPYKNRFSVTPEIVQIWKRHGFFWGGDWKSAKDYMHFTYTNH